MKALTFLGFLITVMLVSTNVGATTPELVSFSAAMNNDWSSYDTLETLSYYAGTYKGGAKFYKTGNTGTASTSDLEMGVFYDSVGNEWCFIDGQVFNVYQFGAKGDNTGNDAPAIQALIYFQRFVNGGYTDTSTLREVNLTPGSFRCTSPVYIPGNTILRGASGLYPELNFIECSGIVGFNHASRGDSSHTNYSGGGDQYFLIKNLCILGDKTANKYGVDFDELYFGRMRNCLISGFDSCIYWKGQVGDITNVRCSDYNTIGLETIGQSLNFDTVTIEKPNTFNSTGVRIGYGGTSYSISFSNLHLEDMKYGVTIENADGVTIKGVRHSNGSTATGTHVVRLKVGSALVEGLSNYNVASNIINDNEPALNEATLNYLPFWVYGSNVSTGTWTPAFEAIDIKNTGTTRLRFVEAANGVLGELKTDLTNGRLKISGTNGIMLAPTGNMGFFGSSGGAKPTITGSRGNNAALASLITALENLGLVADNTSP